MIQKNKLAALFGAEHNMKEVLNVRVGHVLRSFLRLGCIAPAALWNTNTPTHGVAVS